MRTGSPTLFGRRVARLTAVARLAGTGRGVLVIALAFAAVSGLLRLALTDNLQPDDAELVVAAQALRGGYSDQPPLYTWMLWTVFRVTGPGLIGLAVVRAALLVLLFGLTYLTARLLVPDRRLVAPLAFSALLLPAYGWHIATYLTHSLLLGVAVMLTVYAVARVVRDGRHRDYALLGVAVALGVLAKYNFPLAVAAAAAAGLTVPAASVRLLNWRILLTAGVAVLILLPHLGWLAEWGGEVFRLVRNKSNRAESPPYWSGVGQGLWAAVACLAGCLVLVAPLLAWLGRRANRIEPADPVVAWVGRFLGALAVIHVALVFGFGVTRFQDRWVQPFLLPLPLWYLARFAPGTVRGARLLTWATAGVAGAILAAQVAQIVFAHRLPGRYDMRLDYPRLARELDAAGYGKATFIAYDREIIGNLLPHMPGATMWYPAGVETLERPAGGPLVLLWDSRLGEQLPLALMPEIEAKFGPRVIRPARRLVFTLHPRDPAGQSVTVFTYGLPRPR
jgi:4-amino-4-deoxy-L-arabinose transferase-like glycosyltransferase